MSKVEKNYEVEALKFLENDFNQCFQQMRHYDSQITDLMKFLFTAYTALFGLAIGLYKYGVEKDIDFSDASIGALAVGLIIGLFVFGIIIRNRIYYVQVAKYVNEQRAFYFNFKPNEFENKANMYTDVNRPKFFSWGSSHIWLGVVSAIVNAALIGVLIYIIYPGRWRTLLAFAIGLFSVQLVIAVIFLLKKEK